jgi:peroxiredoxin
MVELGELNDEIRELTRREARVVAVSVDGLQDTLEVQKRFPNLLILSDENQSLVNALHAIHRGAGPGSKDIAAPTTVIVNRAGYIEWTFRPSRHIERLAVPEVIDALERHRTMFQPVGGLPIQDARWVD